MGDMSTEELFEALQTLIDSNRDNGNGRNHKTHELIRELQVHQLELEIQNRELRATQQQLTHSRMRYADLYDFSPIGYASLDENGRIAEINITGGKLLRENPHKLITRSFMDFISPECVAAFKLHLRRCRWSRQQRSIDLRLTPRGDNAIDVQLFSMATQDAERHTLQFRTAILDITMRKRAEDAARESRRQLELIVAERTAELTSERQRREDAQRFLYEASSVLSMSLDYEITLWTLARAGIPHLADACVVDMVEDDGSVKRAAAGHAQSQKERVLWDLEANRLKDEFLAIVSHELRTPLTPILGGIYKIRASHSNDEDLKTTLDVIERNAKAQARIVEDLLEISRMTRGQLDFNREPADLLAIIENAVDAIRPSTELLRIRLKTLLDPPPRLIWCDRERIQQVIWNLLSNAIKFTERGGTIEVQLENSPGWAHIRIADTGVGISSDFLPYIFEPFRQAGNFVTRMHGGLGVGLSIVRYIVERHGGSVRAESSGEGRGATFIVDLPY